jgi:type IV pilus assembly protein PilO
MFVIILTTLVMIFLWYQYIIVEKTKKVSELESQLNLKQAELNKINAVRPRLKRLREEIALGQLQLDSLRSIFPDKKEIPKLIREITRVANDAGIFTNKFIPLPDITREHYVENNYQMSVTGGYHELALFFNALADFELIINLGTIVIQVNPGVAGSIQAFEEHSGIIETVVATFTLTTFSSMK